MKRSTTLEKAIKDREAYIEDIQERFGIILLKESIEGNNNILMFKRDMINEEDYKNVLLNLVYHNEIIKNIEIWGW